MQHVVLKYNFILVSQKILDDQINIAPVKPTVAPKSQHHAQCCHQFSCPYSYQLQDFANMERPGAEVPAPASGLRRFLLEL